jgi:hypothetical protein
VGIILKSLLKYMDGVDVDSIFVAEDYDDDDDHVDSVGLRL